MDNHIQVSAASTDFTTNFKTNFKSILSTMKFGTNGVHTHTSVQVQGVRSCKTARNKNKIDVANNQSHETRETESPLRTHAHTGMQVQDNSKHKR